MNRLRGQVAYISGAIDRCPNLGMEWRNWLQPILIEKYGVIPFNPMQKPCKIAGEHEFREERKRLKREGRFDKIRPIIKEIRHVDLRMCDKSDFGIFYLDVSIHACGTYEELSWMNRERKPCLVVCKQGKREIPDWLLGSLPPETLMEDWTDLFMYMDHINTSDVIDDLGRWIFWDYSLIKGIDKLKGVV